MVVEKLSVREGTASAGAQGLGLTSGQGKRSQGKKAKTARSTRDSDIGDALRTIYQKTVHEDVPPEMLDLIDKLG